MSENWRLIANLADVPDGEVIGVVVDGRPVALCRVDGELYATAGLCTHQAVLLSEGFLEGYEIECSLHQGRFDVRTGQALCAPVTEPLATYPVRVEGDQVYVALSPP
jgi:naphthalene 1,2-dioxygenase system ferredoxin subunit